MAKNIRKTICILLSLVLLLPGAMSLQAGAAGIVDTGSCGAEGSDLTWTLYDDGLLTITGTGEIATYSSYAYGHQSPFYYRADQIKRVVIEDGCTSIGGYAFYWCNNLESVEMPDSVTLIMYDAFCSCIALTSVRMSARLERIQEDAFYNCRSLTSIELPETLTYCNQPFGQCTSLTSVHIPAAVEYLGTESPFGGCSSLTELTVDPANTRFYMQDGCLIDKNGHRLFSGVGACVIPDDGSVTSIADSALAGNVTVASVIIPEGVTTIGYDAFSGCSNLSFVSLPESLTYLAGRAFQNCVSLTRMRFPAGMGYVYGDTLNGCTSLKCVTFEGGNDAGPNFRGCTSLESLAFGENLYAVQNNCFNGCTSLQKVYIPVSSRAIYGNAFENCVSLTDIWYGGSEADWANMRIYNGTYDHNEAVLTATVHYNHVHTPGAPVAEDVIAPTCTESGSCWKVIYCEECGMALSQTFTELAPAHAWSEPVWTWTEDYSASAFFTCAVCDAETTVAAEVTYDAGMYTAAAVLDGVTYTDTKAKTVTLTFDMGGKAENTVLTLPVGERLILYIVRAFSDSDDGAYRTSGFLSKPQEQFEDFDAIRADRTATFLLTMPETDLTLYALWNEYVPAEISVAAPKCGLPAADVGNLFTWSAPEKYEVYAFEADTDDTVLLGGKSYEIYASVAPKDGFMLVPEAPAVTGAALIECEPGGMFAAISVMIAPSHYTDETSRIEEKVLTPATATKDGKKEICVYCAGGCGEIVETRTEVIPATGEPEGPSGTDNVCPWCGEIHDSRTFVGWWIEFFHDLFFILRQLFIGWK